MRARYISFVLVRIRFFHVTFHNPYGVICLESYILCICCASIGNTRPAGVQESLRFRFIQRHARHFGNIPCTVDTLKIIRSLRRELSARNIVRIVRCPRHSDVTVRNPRARIRSKVFQGLCGYICTVFSCDRASVIHDACRRNVVVIKSELFAFLAQAVHGIHGILPVRRTRSKTLFGRGQKISV